MLVLNVYARDNDVVENNAGRQWSEWKIDTLKSYLGNIRIVKERRRSRRDRKEGFEQERIVTIYDSCNKIIKDYKVKRKMGYWGSSKSSMKYYKEYKSTCADTTIKFPYIFSTQVQFSIDDTIMKIKNNLNDSLVISFKTDFGEPVWWQKINPNGQDIINISTCKQVGSEYIVIEFTNKSDVILRDKFFARKSSIR